MTTSNKKLSVIPAKEVSREYSSTPPGKFQFRAVWPYAENLNPRFDALEVVVQRDKLQYHSSFYTFDYALNLRKRFKRSGENARGLYINDKNLTLIEDLSPDSIRTAIDDMIKIGGFGNAFTKLPKRKYLSFS